MRLFEFVFGAVDLFSCDVGVGGVETFKLNEEKTLRWLEQKITRLVDAFGCSASLASLTIKSTVSIHLQGSNQGGAERTAWSVVNDLVSDELMEKLKLRR